MKTSVSDSASLRPILKPSWHNKSSAGLSAVCKCLMLDIWDCPAPSSDLTKDYRSDNVNNSPALFASKGAKTSFISMVYQVYLVTLRNCFSKIVLLALFGGGRQEGVPLNKKFLIAVVVNVSRERKVQDL